MSVSAPLATATTASTQATPDQATSSSAPPARFGVTPYFAVGIAFGIVLVRGEVISWYRIQEMFHFQSFHMYGILGSAAMVAMASLLLLQRTAARTTSGQRISVEPKVLGTGRRYWIGGLLFGFGWALCGACPGPLFALVGSGMIGFVLVAVAALVGAWIYGWLRPRLPH